MRDGLVSAHGRADHRRDDRSQRLQGHQRPARARSRRRRTGRAPRAWAPNLRPRDLLGRLGGDEFVLLMPGTDPARAAAVVERLRASSVSITFAAGVAPWSGEELDAWIAVADSRLYADKGPPPATTCPSSGRPSSAARAGEHNHGIDDRGGLATGGDRAREPGGGAPLGRARPRPSPPPAEPAPLSRPGWCGCGWPRARRGAPPRRSRGRRRPAARP
ncbi:GGDEF domain-containing protein [Cellulomonas sp. ATA003]|uniref:GGDEF domain-containing protein n=1 Tax=Cellulomonas sp. ATA003 TaxID=3073064 RepID=UPI0037BED16D